MFGSVSFSNSRNRFRVVSDDPPNAFFKVEKTNHFRMATCASASSAFDEVSNARLPRFCKYRAIGKSAKGATTFFELNPNREISRTVAASDSLMFPQLLSIIRKLLREKFLTLYWMGRFSVKYVQRISEVVDFAACIQCFPLRRGSSEQEVRVFERLSG